MRLTVLLLALVALTSCMSGGGSSGDDGSAEETRRATTDVVESAVPITAEVLGSDRIDMHGEWFECMKGMSWKYKVGGAVTAASGDVTTRLEDVKAALLEAGFTETLTTDSQVSVEKDGVAFTLRRPPVGHERVWSVFVESDCGPYSDGDQALIEQDSGNDFPDLRG
jgi:hypothetical protein